MRTDFRDQTLNQCLPSSSSPHDTINPLLPITFMNQVANIPIMACRTHAGTDSQEALRMWKLWNDMVCLPLNSFRPQFRM